MAETQRKRGRLSDPDDDGVQDVDLPADEKQAIEAAGEYVDVPVGDITVRIKPQSDWRMSDMRMLNVEGNFDGWAESVIHPDDLEPYTELDITMAEFQRFAADAANLSGDGLGKSRGRSKSSRSTRRR